MQKLEKQYHIHCAEGDVGRYVIVVQLVPAFRHDEVPL